MAYTGTGTQADPFVVTTFADFLECVAQDGVYVEVGADLDAAAEGFGYIEPIDVKAVEVYGTSGDTLRKISNVTVEGNAALNLGNTGTVQSISGLYLENWGLKATSDACVVRKSNSNGAYVQHCKISVSATADDSATICYVKSGYVSIIDCAVVMQVHNCVWLPSNSAVSAWIWKNMTIRVEGDGITAWEGSTQQARRFSYAANTGLILKNMNCTGAFGFSSGDGFNYMVFEDCTLPGTGSIYGVKSSNLICFAGTTSDESARVNSGTVVTQSQLKDKAYLQSIGWLP